MSVVHIMSINYRLLYHHLSMMVNNEIRISNIIDHNTKQWNDFFSAIIDFFVNKSNQHMLPFYLGWPRPGVLE